MPQKIPPDLTFNPFKKGFYTINGGTSESATEIRGAPGITRDVGFTAYSYKVQVLILY